MVKQHQSTNIVGLQQHFLRLHDFDCRSHNCGAALQNKHLGWIAVLVDCKRRKGHGHSLADNATAHPAKHDTVPCPSLWRHPSQHSTECQDSMKVPRSACYRLQGDRVQTGSGWVHDLAYREPWDVRDGSYWSCRSLQVCSNLLFSRALSVDFGAGNTEAPRCLTLTNPPRESLSHAGLDR